jgi:MFS superfamily sulfate permease-like transporter
MAASGQFSRADVLCGVSLAGLLLPEAVAYSGLANLPPQAGVIGLFAGLLCYALIGRSRYAIVTATSSSAAVLAAATLALGGMQAGDRVALAALLVCGTGLVFVLAGSARLGAISNLIARPVLRGFSFGLALTIVVKQWPHVTHLPTTHTDFFPLLAELIETVPSWQPASLGVGVGALVALYALERLRRVPGVLIVIALGIAAGPWLAAHGVTLTGPFDLHVALPTFFLPARRQWLPLVEFSLALSFILYAESYGSIRTFALKHNEEVEPNRDLVALGVANLVSGLFQGTPVGAGYSGTSANEAAGAQSRASGLFAAATVLLLVVVCLPLIARIPAPVLAAVVIHAVGKSLRTTLLRRYFVWRRDRLVSLMAVVAVLLLGMINGLLAAIAFSVAMLLRSLASPRLSILGRLGAHDFVDVARFPHAARTPDTLILRPEEPLFFANVEPLLALARQWVLARAGVRRVILSLEESPDLDGSALEGLGDFADWLQERRIVLQIARLKDSSRDALDRARFEPLTDRRLSYASVDDAVSDAGVVVQLRLVQPPSIKPGRADKL